MGNLIVIICIIAMGLLVVWASFGLNQSLLELYHLEHNDNYYCVGEGSSVVHCIPTECERFVGDCNGDLFCAYQQCGDILQGNYKR